MKKIISLLSVFAIVCTMFTTVSFAAGNRIYFEESKSGNKVSLTLVADMAEGASNISGQIDWSDVAAAGVTAKLVSATDGVTFRLIDTAKAKVITFTALDTAATDKYVGKVEFGTIEFDLTAATVNSVAFKQKAALKCSSATGTLDIQNDAFTYTLTKEAETKLEGAGGDMVNPGTGLKEKTYITGVLELAAGLENPVVEITDEAGEKKEYKADDWYPQVKGAGTVNVLAIVRYAGDTAKTFTLNLK